MSDENNQPHSESDEDPEANLSFLIPSFLVSLMLLVCLMVFALKYRSRCSSILKVIGLLLLNELFESIFQSIGFMGSISNFVCSVSIVGKASFTVAANFWIIFITRLLYLEKLQPGKYFNMLTLYGRNVALTYVPSIVVAVFLSVIINLDDTQSENHCWRVITKKEALDYVIYVTCYILPNLLAMVISGVYLSLYFRVRNESRIRNRLGYLTFPIVEILFSLYYILLRVYMFFSEKDRIDQLEIPLILEPLLYMVFFVYLIKVSLRRKTVDTSMEYTIKEDSLSGSFVQDIEKKKFQSSF